MKKIKKDAKQRIFETAIKLFARRGFDAVGIREIAKTAGVQISMINYYYEGKAGILREIVNDTYRKYFDAILKIGGEDIPLEKRIRTMVKNLVEFFRYNTELAIVGISAMPLDIPEITDLRIKWVSDNRGALNRLMTEMGLDTTNELQMSVVRSLLTSVIYNHFESKYSWDLIVNAPVKPKLLDSLIELENEKGKCCMPEDSFYEQYADMLATYYIHGVQSVVNKKSI